jgi:RimJ/RimL family protein N-acetyltransferase
MPGALSPAYPDVVPVLSDGIVTLRAHRQSDVADIVQQCNDPEMVRFTTVPQPYGVQEAQVFIGTIVPGGWADEHGTRAWAIEAKDPNGIPRFAGSVDYRPPPEGVAEVGFGLHPWARGRGVMTRAVRLALAHAFEHGIETVHWRAVVGNWGSRRVAWSCGFTVEGTVRGLLAQRGERRDGWIGTLAKGTPMQPAKQWLDTPTLEGERVRLRPWREDDRPRPDQAPDELSQTFMAGFVPTTETFDAWLVEQRARPAEGDSVVWCIADAASDEALGSINVFRLGFDLMAGSGMVAYWLHPQGRGRGALSEAVDLVVGHAFTPKDEGGLGLHRLEAGTDIGNRGSQRALRRAGFVQVGHEHEVMAHPEGPTDGLHFELLRSSDREAARVAPTVPAVLETERLRLREWRESDRPRPDQGIDDASARFMPAGAQPDVETFDEWLERKRRELDTGTACLWCVADRETDAALGTVQIFAIGEGSPGNAELGYWLHTDARGRGFAGEAVAAAVEHAFRPAAEGGLGLRRLHAVTDRANTPSQRILQGAGFRLWGIDHQSYARSDGSISDGAFFELLADDNRGGRAGAGVQWTGHATRDQPAAGAQGGAGRGEAGRGLEPATIEGRGIRLREWQEDDIPRIVEACTDPVSRHWLATLPEPYDEVAGCGYVEMTRERHRNGAGLFWCVADARTDRCVGSLGLMDLSGEDPTTAEVGYWLHPDARGRGAMRQAVGLAVRHAFLPVEDGGLGLRRLRLNVAGGNEGSARIAAAIGFSEVGRDRAAERLGDGSYVDLRRFDLLATEWTG